MEVIKFDSRDIQHGSAVSKGDEYTARGKCFGKGQGNGNGHGNGRDELKLKKYKLHGVENYKLKEVQPRQTDTRTQ